MPHGFVVFVAITMVLGCRIVLENDAAEVAALPLHRALLIMLRVLTKKLRL